MAKSPEKSDKVKNISASQILSYLQRNNLTNEIFVEILSDLNNKHGFKSLRKMVEDLIKTHEGPLYSPTTERTRRASIINEICTVAFTIDTIFPNVLRMKFQNQIPSLVNDILEELKAEKKIESYVPFVPFVSTAIPSAAAPAQTIPVPATSHSQKSVSPIKSASPVPSTSKDLQCPVTSTSLEPPIKETTVQPETLRSKRKQNALITPKAVSTPKVLKNKDEDADEAEDNLSLTSVSSVHTSELSSFDDAISVYTGEDNGGEKKRLSIVDIQQACKSDRISSWCAENFNVSKTEAKNVKGNSATKVSGNRAKKSKETYVESEENDKTYIEDKVSSSDESSKNSSSTKGSSSPAKVLPQRIRKPNSKYVSDSIICPIASKQRKRMQEIESAASDRSESYSSQKRQKTIDDDSDDDLLHIALDSPEASPADKENSENRKSPMHSTDNVFKPFTSVRPLTSRKTAPKTLFSTQGLKK